MKTKNLILIMTWSLMFAIGGEARTVGHSRRPQAESSRACPEGDVYSSPDGGAHNGEPVGEVIANDFKIALLKGFMTSSQSSDIFSTPYELIHVQRSEPGEANGIRYGAVPSNEVKLISVEDITHPPGKAERPQQTYRANYEVAIGGKVKKWGFTFIRLHGDSAFATQNGCAWILITPDFFLHGSDLFKTE